MFALDYGKHFPHCLGAVDGKHIRVKKFSNSGSMNLNYKNYFSIVLMAVVDSNYQFIYVDMVPLVNIVIYLFLKKRFFGNY